MPISRSVSVTSQYCPAGHSTPAGPPQGMPAVAPVPVGVSVGGRFFSCNSMDANTESHSSRRVSACSERPAVKSRVSILSP